MRSIRATAIAAIFVLGAGQAVGQSQYTDQVFRQLQGMYDAAAEDGYHLTNFILGSMDEGEDDVWTMTFTEGTEYVIHGACDRDCSDIDLSVLTEAGEVVGRQRFQMVAGGASESMARESVEGGS